VNSVPAAPSLTPPDTLTRAVAGVLVLILVDAAQLLAFYPDRTDTLWAWSIEPPLSAMVLGTVYLAGAYFFARILFGAPWERVAAGFPPIALFVWMALIATLAHLDRFTEDSLPFAAWIAIYLVTPLAVPLLYVRNRKRASRPAAPSLRRGTRLALAIAGAALTLGALTAFAFPDPAIDNWPWALTPLTARITAAVVAVYGSLWLSLAAHGSRIGMKIPLQAHALGLAVVLVAIARGEEAVDWGQALAPAIVAVIAAMLAGSAVLAWKAP
jgi:hypothetical protein